LRSPASDPDNAGKTMLGEAQAAWFKQQLVEANDRYPVIVWFNGIPWIEEENADGWGAYATERRELADFIAARQIHGLVMLSGDAHMLAIDDGTNSDYSTIGYPGFAVMHASALDRHGSAKVGPPNREKPAHPRIAGQDEGGPHPSMHRSSFVYTPSASRNPAAISASYGTSSVSAARLHDGQTWIASTGSPMPRSTGRLLNPSRSIGRPHRSQTAASRPARSCRIPTSSSSMATISSIDPGG
jgi:hypothetical protein